MDGKVTSKGFVCCKEGVRRVDKQDHLYTCRRDEIKTNCHAQLFLSLVRENRKYKVYDLVAEHNHLLHLQETVHMIRSHQKMSEVQAFAIDLTYASGISPKATHELMSREVGGRLNLGYIELDKKKLSSNKTAK